MAFDADNPKCFGDKAKAGRLAECKACRFADGCRWYSDNPPPKHAYGRDSRSHLATLDIYEGEEAAVSPVFGEGDEADDYGAPYFSRADLESLLHFLLYEVDAYSLSAALVMLRGGHAGNVSSVARVFGVGREAMRRKLEDTCRKYPALAKMLEGAMARCARLSDVDNLGIVEGRRGAKARRKNKGQMEIEF